MILKQKVPFSIEIPMIGGLNEDADPSAIGDNEFQVAQKVLWDHKIAEKFPEFTKVNPSAQLESGAAVDGIYRCYADDGTARTIAVCNGSVYSDYDSYASAIYTTLTAGKPCKFIPYRGKVIITNGYDYPVVYHPNSNTVGGSLSIESPYQISKISYFEADETWTGGAADTSAHVDTEWTGDSLQGRKLTATATNTETMEQGSLALDLSTHEDGSTATGRDFIDISVYHRVRENITSITLYLETSSGNYFSFTIPVASLDEEKDRDYQWTDFEIIRDRFSETGTGDWASITKVKIGVTASASGTADPTFDNIRLRRSTLIAGDMRKVVATFEPSEETWSAGSADVTNYKKGIYGGGVGLKLVDGTESAYCDKTLDLTKFADGATLVEADEFSVWVYINDTSKITSITLKCGDADLTNNQAYTFTTEILAGNAIWQELVIPLADCTETGTHAWEDTVRIQVEAVLAAGGECTFDHWVVKFKDSEVEICTLEKDTVGETWTGYFATWSQKYAAKGSWSVETTIRVRVATYFDVTFASGKEKDLSVWGDGSTSVDADDISFWARLGPETTSITLKAINLQVDVNNGDFLTDYYAAKWDYVDFGSWAPGEERTLKRRKQDFARVGATGGKDWSTVKGVRWTLETSPHGEGDRTIYFDDLKMVRKSEFKGLFEWKMVYLYGETRSPASKVSNRAEIVREKALLTNIPTSNDSRVTNRELYRREYGDEDFRFSTRIPNNTSTVWVDEIYEAGLTMDEMGVPRGNILPAKGVSGIEFKDRILLFQDLANLNSIAYTDPFLIYSWQSARLLPSEIVGGEVHFDNLFLFFRDGRVYRTSEDIDIALFQPLGDLLKCVSPWGICKVGEGIGVVTEDDIKIFNGYESTSIGEQLSPYLKQADYKTEESALFYHKDHLYYRVETRAGGAYKQFDCYVPGGQWEESYNEAFKCFCSYTGRGDENEMVCGGYDGYLYKLDVTYDDTMTVRSKDFEEVNTSMGKGFAFHEKEIHEVRVIAKADATGGSLTLKLFVNGVDVGETITVPASGNLATVYHCYVVPLVGVYDAMVGQQIGFSLAHTTAAKNVKVKSVLITGDVLPLEQQFTDE